MGTNAPVPVSFIGLCLGVVFSVPGFIGLAVLLLLLWVFA